MHKLDHIVLAANTLEEGTSYLENKLHIKLSNIGYHKDNKILWTKAPKGTDKFFFKFPWKRDSD